MKSFITAGLLLALIQPVLAQEPTPSSYKVIPIVSKETFTLNSGGRALLGGRSRIDLPVELPANTVEWYYAVTTSPEKMPAPSIGLAGQLIKLLTPSGMISTVMSALVTPSGSGACDVYLIPDQDNLNRFINKRPQFASLMSGSRQNFNQGAVQVRDAVKGSLFLGLRNPSAVSAVQVTIEVCAIVKE
jgi:hypothetical protein